MKRILGIGFTALFLLSFPAQLSAQEEEYVPDIVQEPICFMLVNEAPYKVYGGFNTDWYVDNDGKKRRHRNNFRLEKPGTLHEKGYPLDRAEFCTYGPFYPGRKLELTIRTLVPVFACQTKIDQGPIIISGRRKPEGGAETTAACFE